MVRRLTGWDAYNVAMLRLVLHAIKQLFRAPGNMLRPGEKAPDITATDQYGEEIRLSDYRGKKVVLWFYPKADTPG